MNQTTKFCIYLQPPYIPGFEQPISVEIETEEEVKPGPRDSLLYVVDAENKPKYRAEAPHKHQRYCGRPWKGDINPVAALPNYDGNFDHLTPDDPAFPAASVYATARLVLNFWNRIFDQTDLGKITAWHHQPDGLIADGEEENDGPQLQLIPRCVSAGSRTGYGYIEVGRDNPGHEYRPCEDKTVRVYQSGEMWQNFDVIAHEMGHAILFARIGFPKNADKIGKWFELDREFLVFHEAMADLSAILSLLDRKEARQFFLTRRNGIALVAGIAELQRLDKPGFLPIRSALVKQKYPGPKFKNEEAHKISMSLTGAVFTSLMQIYENLREAIQRENGVGEKEAAAAALEQANSIVSRALARLWADPDYLWSKPEEKEEFSLLKVAEALPELMFKELPNGKLAALTREKLADPFKERGFRS